jgi:uncharacterized protein YlxW (UPF0749 family)
MRKLASVSFVIIVLLSAVFGVLFYQISDLQNRNSNLQNQITQLENEKNELENHTRDLEAYVNNVSNANQVKITKMSIAFTQMLLSFVDVTVKNFGTSDVDGLNLTLTNDSGDNMTITLPIGIIHAGEEKHINEGIEHRFFQWSNTFFATIMFDDITLDEYEYDKYW